MPRLLFLCLGLLLCAGGTRGQQAPTPDLAPLLAKLNAPTWPQRSAAFQQLRPWVDREPAVQAALVRLCRREGFTPDWEDDNFIRYFTTLAHLVQDIAVRTNDPRAWMALVSGSYNPDSDAGRWFSTQWGAVRAEVGLLDSQYASQRANAAYVLALSLGEQELHCDGVAFHFPANEKQVVLKRILALAAEDPDPTTRYFAVEGLEFISGDERERVLDKIIHSNAGPFQRKIAQRIKDIPRAQAVKHTCACPTNY